MKFGDYPVSRATGLVLAHTVKLEGGVLQKGKVLSQREIEILGDAGVSHVAAACICDTDLSEDVAALCVAQSISSDLIVLSAASTGRVNIFAAADGMFVADKTAVDRLNGVDPEITLSCLADHTQVRKGDMVATVKIIPLAVPRLKVEEACRLLSSATPFRVNPFVSHAVTLVATELASLKTTVMDKTARVLADRLLARGSQLIREQRVPHTVEALAGVLEQTRGAETGSPALIVIFGASAVIDRDDIIPAAIRNAGGSVLRVGMPVDPGNLAVLGRIGQTYVIGAPGCARSPKQNGLDWILDRVLTGEKLTGEDIGRMGVGGLLHAVSIASSMEGRQRTIQPPA